MRARSIDSAELSALEMSAGIIGAALHRERLVDAVRRERERAAEERVDHMLRAVAAARDAGKYRLEGKEYVFQDGDVALFRFNV